MRITLDTGTNLISSATLAFGGMAPTTKIAQLTSQHLINQPISPTTLSSASSLLLEELELSYDAPGGMPAYRQVLAQSFLQRFFSAIISWNSKLPTLTRGPTSGVQLYQVVPHNQKVEDLIGRPIPHLSALKHATGEAIYTEDELPVAGQLYGYLVGSPLAHAKILEIDAKKALAYPGVVAFITAKDIPKDRNMCGPLVPDEEIFASQVVQCEGQTIGIIVAEDPLTAEKASKMVSFKFEALPTIITTEEALEHKSFHAVKKLNSGDVNKAFEKSDHFLEGEMRIGGQEHFYMETQSCIATPHEDREMDVLISCQGPDLVQKSVAKALNVPANRIKVRCMRMGGAFGGKETRSLMIGLPTAVAADILGRSVRTVMNRLDDMVSTGGRHPFLCRYKVGVSKEGRILGIDATLASNAGWSLDTSPVVMEKALLSIDAAYTINNWRCVGYVCKTNLASNTAFRGYGGPQASIFLENIIEHVAEVVGKSLVELRWMHLKKAGIDKVPLGYAVEDNCSVRRCWEEVIRSRGYEKRRLEVKRWNEKNKERERGIAVMPMKHDVGFHFGPMNQAGALEMIYSDGSVGLNHGGTEMGQGLATKMAQVASRVLGVGMDRIYSCETSTDKVANSTATCGSFSSDLNGMAVKNACETLMQRLSRFIEEDKGAGWNKWVEKAYMSRVNLSAVGFYEVDLHYDFNNSEDIRKSPCLYSVYGVAVSVVEVDLLTGEHSVLRTDIFIDVGESLNPAVDVGQIEGALVQGYGLFTMEELVYSLEGRMISKGPGMYKVAGMGDVPRVFNVALLRGAENKKAVYSSKGVGEPPLFLAASIYFAIREAVKEGRGEWFRLDSPATVERIRMAVGDEVVSRIGKRMEMEGKGKKGWGIRV